MDIDGGVVVPKPPSNSAVADGVDGAAVAEDGDGDRPYSGQDGVDS